MRGVQENLQGQTPGGNDDTELQQLCKTERKQKQQTKRLQRKLRNLEGKRLRAAQRQIELVELGKTLIKTEVDGPEVDGKPTKVVKYELPERVVAPAFNNPPHLSFAGMKRYRQHWLRASCVPATKSYTRRRLLKTPAGRSPRNATKQWASPPSMGSR